MYGGCLLCLLYPLLPTVRECRRQRSTVKTLLFQHCALRKFHVTDGQNTRDQITSDRRSKRALCTFQSLLVAGEWLATYMRRMRNNNLEFCGLLLLPAITLRNQYFEIFLPFVRISEINLTYSKYFTANYFEKRSRSLEEEFRIRLLASAC